MSRLEEDREETDVFGAWRIVAVPGWIAWLRGRGPAFLDEPAESAGVEILRESRVRTVLRIRSEGVVWKAYRVLDPFARWRSVLRPSRARVEFGLARALRALGVPAAKPLAFGERRRGAFLERAFYLCEEIRDAIPSDLYFEVLDVERGRRLRLLGAFVARLHECGAVHGDLHARNVLVRPGGSPSFHLVDLHAARRREAPGLRARARDLAALVRGLGPALKTEDERDALLHGYLAAAHLEAMPAFSEALRREGARLEARRLRSRGRRALEDSPEFALERERGRRVFRRRAVSRESIEGAIAAHASASGGEVLDVMPRGRATRVPGPGGETWFVKEVRSRGALRALVDGTRASRGRRAWIGARLLELIGLPAPQSLALVEERRGPMLVRSFLVRRFLDDAKTLRAFLAEDYDRLPPGAKRGFLTQAAGVAGRLVRAGLLHRDLSTKNLLVRREESGFEFSWIDLEDIRRRRSSRVAPLHRGLAQLNDAPGVVSRSDRLRFLRAWEAATGILLSRAEIAWIVARTRARVRRRERRLAAP